MAQYLKEDVQQAIAGAALGVFAERGYAGATMAEIARAAGVSTGNIYRYHAGKAELLDAVVSDELVRALRRLLRRRVRALEGIDDIGKLPATAPYLLASEELLAFVIEHRLQVVILLGRAQGSRHERFSEQTVAELIALALAHFESVRPRACVTPTMRFTLDHIYRSFVGAMVGILATYDDEATIRQAVGDYAKYHLAGLRNLFA
jgi:AcrR family transcriptional regulator